MGIDIAGDNDAALPATIPPESEVSKALALVSQHNVTMTGHMEQARELAATYKDVAFAVATTKGMEDAAKARAALREHRYAIQKLQPIASKMLGQMQRQVNQQADAFCAEIEAAEKPIDEQITAEQARKAAIKAEKERAEAARVQGHTEAIARIAALAGAAAGLDSAALRERIAQAGAIIVDSGYEEFQGQAMQAKDEALRQLNGMLVAALGDEEERAELERTRQQQAAFAAEQAAREKALADEREAFEREKREHEAARLREQEAAAAKAREEQAALAKQQQELERQRLENERAVRERADAIEERIGRFRAAAVACQQPGVSSDAIAECLGDVEAAGANITAAYFGDRTAEAAQFQQASLNTIRAMLQVAQEREAQEAAQARAARIEELLAAIENMGEDASDAVKDGSADVAKLRIGLKALQETQCTPELFDDRVSEAVALKTAAEEIIEWAIKATQERDRLRAEEAERQRLAAVEAMRLQQEQEEADRAMRERHLRMQAKAPEMFALLKEAADGNTYPLAPDLGARADAIIKFVEGDAV